MNGHDGAPTGRRPFEARPAAEHLGVTGRERGSSQVQIADLKLVAPLSALFAAFFIAPLCILIIMSLSTDAEMHAFTAANYIKFFTDVLPGQIQPLGSPGGAAKLGALDGDTEMVAALPPQEN